jgi:hypothetical protein
VSAFKHQKNNNSIFSFTYLFCFMNRRAVIVLTEGLFPWKPCSCSCATSDGDLIWHHRKGADHNGFALPHRGYCRMHALIGSMNCQRTWKATALSENVMRK